MSINLGSVEELLSPFTAEERIRPRRAKEPDLQAFAGLTRGGLYRLAERGEIEHEKSPGRARDGQRRAASGLFFTLLGVARWRASRAFTPASEGAHVVELKKAVRIRDGRARSGGVP